MSGTGKRVGLAGAGSVALGTAALLCVAGHLSMLWSPTGESTRAFAAGEPLRAYKAIEGEFQLAVARDAAQLAAENEVLILALPAYAHRRVMDALVPHIRPEHTIIISSQASLGALYLARGLQARGVRATIVSWGTTLVTGRRQLENSVLVNTVRAKVDVSAVPASKEAEALALCRGLFGDRFVPRDGLLAISLSNLNPQNHMGIALGNMTRMERGERWNQAQNVTPKVGALLEALDRERLAIADALGLKVRTIFEHFHHSFHVPMGSISDMNQVMHAQGNGGIGPASAESRYVTEDVPYGLVFTAFLGRRVGRTAALHEAGVAIFSAMYGRDFTAENELLAALELESIPLEALKRAARSGVLEATV